MHASVLLALLGLLAVLGLPAPFGLSPAHAQGETVSEKSTALKAQIEAARARLEEAATERPDRTPPARRGAPSPSATAPRDAASTVEAKVEADAEAGLRLALAIALNRPPSAEELRMFLEAHSGLSVEDAISWAAFPDRWRASSDPVERMEGYEERGSHAYCTLANVMDSGVLAEAFSLDPVVAARCRGGNAFVLRESGLKAALNDIAFAADATGTSQLSRADAASVRVRLPHYFAGEGRTQAVENWSRAASRHVRFQLQWAALGQTEAGRRRQLAVVAFTRDSGEAPVQRADVLRSQTWRHYALADFNDFMDGLNGIGQTDLEGSLATHCVLASTASCY